ncbi:type VII secretion protein EccE [Aldersonia sp. NBC_00410]|uniref:type VII secretion protein EccE n=1 Tax=Aldersonia sp. NBC_00410 TaxID=2975954 RepID=UPI002250B48C|nr:type VII secretion protein EccE [Aldersonia sp. NBC_00410]MCX5043937.1 type VII secretion protein EccE [Aldersonia sp. NBC_00410]
MPDRRGSRPRPVWDRITGADVLAAQSIAVVAGVGAAAASVCVLIAVGISVAVALILLIPIARNSLFGWLRIARRYRDHSEYPLGQTVDFRSPDGRSLGLYWDGSRVVAVVEVLAPVGGLTSISRADFDATHLLPVADLARNLDQHDIQLAGIDIVSHGYRSRSGTPAGGVYEQLIGPLPATAVRTVWLAICFDALACPDAVERRGGGAEGASRAITIATRRIVRALDEVGCRSRVLTAPEIREAVLQITGGTDPRRLMQSWKFAQLGENVNIGSAIQPNALSSELLARLWVAPSRGTTTVVRLRPGSTPESVSVGAAWRLTSRALPELPKTAGVVTMSGRHRDAVLAHLPIAVADLEDVVPRGDMAIAKLDRLRLPTAGCGQLVGSDAQGNGIATRLVGTGVSTVYLAGELYLAQQVVFRALAIGARVLVRTDRPHDWEPMVTAVASPDKFRVVTETQYSDAGFNATMIDGVVAPPPHAGVTTMYLTSDPSQWPGRRADVSLHQPGAVGSRVMLESSGKSVELNLVSIPRETSFIGRPRAPRRRPEPTYAS